MQQPQVPTLLALQTVKEFGANSEYHRNGIKVGLAQPVVFEILAQRSGKTEKQAWRALEKLTKQGYVAHGSSVRTPWLTDHGETHLLRLEDPEKFGTTPLAPRQPFSYPEKSWSRKHAPAVFEVSEKDVLPCTHCGCKPEFLKADPLKFWRRDRQMTCGCCGSRGPRFAALSIDNSYPIRWATRSWNCLMLGIKLYGRKNHACERPDTALIIA